MGHFEQREFLRICKQFMPGFFHNKFIIEFGSYSVNFPARDFFTDCNYLGIDLIDGPGVDLVIRSDKFDGKSESFDTALSCECFEHNPFWLETFFNMIRLTRPGGLILFTCGTTGRPEHGTLRTNPSGSPGTNALGWTYYGNLTEKDFTKRICLSLHFSYWKFFIQPEGRDLYFYGIKKGGDVQPSNEQARDLEKQMHSIRPPKLELGIIKKLIYRTAKALPTIVSNLLPDKSFQNFYIYYKKIGEKIFGSLIRDVHSQRSKVIE